MLIVCKNLSELNIHQLMDVYEQSNMEKGKGSFPFDPPEMQLRKARDNFLDYLRYEFFKTPGACLCIWEEDGQYVSALRLEPYEDGYLLCALETRPKFRRMGYATALIDAILRDIDAPVYSHIYTSNYLSVAAHKAVGFSLLKNGARLLDGTVSAKYDTYIY